jgi:hypothetical protein
LNRSSEAGCKARFPGFPLPAFVVMIRYKEVQERLSCRGFGGVPHFPYTSPKEWGNTGG